MSGADYNPTTSGNDTMSGSDYNATAHGSGGLEGNAYNPTANDTTSTSNSTLDNPTLYNDTSNTSLMNDTATSTTPETPPSEAEEPPLVVSTTQYRVNGHQRVLLSLTYGQSNITQLWEAHNGTLTVVPIPLNETGGKADDEGDEVSIDPMETPTTTVSGGGEPYFPIGTGNAGMGGAASNDTNAPYGGGADMMGITSGAGARPTTTPMGTPTPSSSMGYQVDAGVAGASGSPVAVVVNLDAPDVNHPGFVGPKARLKAKRFLKGGEGEVR